MKVYSLLTGRGRNTLRDKNVLDVLGHPVLYYPATAVKNSKFVEANYCSSDDEKILSEAEKVGYTPIKRPLELALPSAQHVDCIFHGLEVIGKEKDLPDILVVVLANNVTVKTEWVDDCIEMMMHDMSTTAVVPVYMDNDHHPFRAKRIDSDGKLVMYDHSHAKEAKSSNRQDLPECYFLAHNFWVLNVKELLKKDNLGEPPWGFMGNNVRPYCIDASVDIHDLTDLELARMWLQKHKIAGISAASHMSTSGGAKNSLKYYTVATISCEKEVAA